MPFHSPNILNTGKDIVIVQDRILAQYQNETMSLIHNCLELVDNHELLSQAVLLN